MSYDNVFESGSRIKSLRVKQNESNESWLYLYYAFRKHWCAMLWSG